MTWRLFGALGISAVLFVTGLTTGSQVYYLLSIVLVLLIVLSLLAALWTLLTLRVDIKGVRPRVTRGDTLMTLFTVYHASLLPVGSVRVIVGVPSFLQPTQELGVSTPPFRARTYRHAIACPHRGSYETGVNEVCVVDLFGFFHIRRRQQEGLVRVDVLPRVEDAQPLEMQVTDVGQETFSRATEDTASPSSVRQWQDGDVLKRVHWKLTMRKRELMVRTYEESSRPDTLILPDLGEISALTDQRLTMEDAIVEAAASAARAQLSGSDPVRMPLVNGEPSEISGQFPTDFPMFHEALMRVSFESPYPYEQVLMLMQPRMLRTGGAVLITAALNSRVADAALRMQRSGVNVKLISVTESEDNALLEMLERLRMEGVKVERVDPWADRFYMPPQESAPLDDLF